MIKDLTLFTTCKPFEGLVGIHQENALRSWAKLGVRILVLGDEPGVREIVGEIGAEQIVDVARNDDGLPMVSSLFSLARGYSQTPYLAYLNADIVLLPDFCYLMAAVNGMECDGPLLAVSRRQNIPLNDRVDFEASHYHEMLEELVHKRGSWDHSYAIDLFLFHRDLYNDIPNFSIGRPMWDNWMLSEARRVGADIVDGSGRFSLLHPIHGYGGAWAEVTHGVSAQKNRNLGPSHACNIEDTSTHFVTLQLGVKTLGASDLSQRKQEFKPDNGKELDAFIAYFSKVNFIAEPRGLDDIKAMLWRWQRYFPMEEGLQSDPMALPRLLDDVVALCRDGADEAALDLLQDFVATLLIQKVRAAATENRAVYVWGAGQYGQRLNQLLLRHDVEITGFVDKSYKSYSDETSTTKVAPPSLLARISVENPLVIIGTMFFSEVAAELEELGFSEANYIY